MLHVLKQRNETHNLRVKAGHTTDTRLDFLPLVSCPVLDVRDIENGLDMHNRSTGSRQINRKVTIYVI